MGKFATAGLIAFLTLGFYSTAHAQRGGGAASAARVGGSSVSVHAHHIFTTSNLAARPLPPKRTSGVVTASSHPNVIVYGPNSGVTLQNLNSSLSGIGVDNGQIPLNGTELAEMALIDPATREELALAARFQRNLPFTGAYLLTDYGSAPVAYDEPQQDSQAPPQVIIIQQPAAGPGTRAAESAPAEESAPLTDAGEFTLVLKDGSQISAVAFTRQGDQLVYITREGNRRSVSYSQVDSTATTKLNDERGTALKLSL
ncbi:MAG: hypothetical protein WCA98_08885 [Candidatus Acidiferrales bacterium]